MITWKCLPGILYQMEGEGKRARQRRDIERVCLRSRTLQERKIASAIKKTVREKTCDANVRLFRKINNTNDVIHMIWIRAQLVYKQHLDLMTSHTFPILCTKRLLVNFLLSLLLKIIYKCTKHYNYLRTHLHLIQTDL
jgi:hypothetical protein